MGSSSQMVGGVLLVTLLLVILIGGPFILAGLMNYVFSPGLIAVVFGGPIGYWKAFGLGVLITVVMNAGAPSVKAN